MADAQVVVLLLSSLVLVVHVLELVLVPIVSVLEIFDVLFALRDLSFEPVDLFVQLLHLGDVVAIPEASERIVEKMDPVSLVLDAGYHKFIRTLLDHFYLVLELLHQNLVFRYGVLHVPHFPNYESH